MKMILLDFFRGSLLATRKSKKGSRSGQANFMQVCFI